MLWDQSADRLEINVVDVAGANLSPIHCIATLDGPTGYYYGVQSDIHKSGTDGIDDMYALAGYIEILAGDFTTTGRVAALMAMLSGTGAPCGDITGEVYVAWLANRGVIDTVDAILCLHQQSAAQCTQIVWVDQNNATQAMMPDGIIFDGTYYKSILYGNAGFVPSGYHAMEIKGTVTDGSSEGVAAYFEGHAAGTLTGVGVWGVKAWLNADAGAVCTGHLRALDVGFYGGAADYTTANIFAASFTTMVDSSVAAPATHYMMRFNTEVGVGKDTPDSWFHSANPEAVACSNSNVVGTKTASIRVSITGSDADPGYIYLYDTE